ncbi:ubiquitin carboxyl-terminal hydrolase 5 [Coprinopsis cinerea AmutBmut pab1-1]|nr:ubiquitin carboxyl-terminal hydrolase 5 [Coprinopsis cinerea AmutBmut pab1-1]
MSPNLQPGIKDTSISVRDTAAFVDRYMPKDVAEGYITRELKAFTWRINQWSALEPGEARSPEFTCAGFKWRIYLVNRAADGRYPSRVSLYLECMGPAGGASSTQEWSVPAQGLFAISNAVDPTIHHSNAIHHRFNPDEHDWGFNQFLDTELLASTATRPRPFVENDQVDITAFVHVVQDPTGVLWRTFFGDYDSKKTTGHVGIKNLGSTGYMNVLLQALYFTNAFPKIIFQIPTEGRRWPERNTPLALQRLLYSLMTSEEAVSTLELTKSFGWKPIDCLIAHDVLEFYRVFIDNLDTKIKGTPAGDSLRNMISGKMKSFLRPINMPDQESSRIETFTDLQLNVKNLKDLNASLRDYTSTETIEDYPFQDLGNQNVLKGITFESFPPFLLLSLKRFEYDIATDSMVKLHDRFEYPARIDLAEFLSETVAAQSKSEPWVYRLHAVISHDGGIHGGQYLAYVQPDRQRWLKFDDDRVTPVIEREVFEGNFGGYPSGPNSGKSAYVLVYIRESAREFWEAPMELDVPAHIRNPPPTESKVVKPEDERQKNSKFMTVKLVTEQSFTFHQGFDLAQFDGPKDEESRSPSAPTSFRILKTETLETFKSRVSDHFDELPEDSFMFWSVILRQNQTIRAHAPLHGSIPGRTPDDLIIQTMDAIRSSTSPETHVLRLYLDRIPPGLQGSPFPPPGCILVFLKYFDASQQSLIGLSKIYAPRTEKIGVVLAPVLQKALGWPLDEAFRVYEEIKPTMIERINNLKRTFEQSELIDGDILCIQSEISSQETSDLKARGLATDPVEFYERMRLAPTQGQTLPGANLPSSTGPKAPVVPSPKHTSQLGVVVLGEKEK